jgi:hypothetical protein
VLGHVLVFGILGNQGVVRVVMRQLQQGFWRQAECVVNYKVRW